MSKGYQELPPPMDDAEAKRLVAKYQDKLNKALFEQETNRDKTLVLISGGALTVSFAFVTTLVGHPPILRIWWLVGSWAAWVGALMVTIASYSISIYAFHRRTRALAAGDYERAREDHWSGKCIEPVNILTSVLTVIGFVVFGVFVIGNVMGYAEGRNNDKGIVWKNDCEKGQAQVHTEKIQIWGRGDVPGQLGTAATPRLPGQGVQAGEEQVLQGR